MASYSVKLTSTELRYIALFESITGAVVKDCIVDEEEGRIVFVIKPGDIGMAIGKRGTNIKRVRDFIKKPIDVVEYADTPEDFIKNTLAPARIKSIHITEKRNGRKVAVVNVDPKDKGIAIGKAGKNVARARLLARRHFQIDDVIIG
ncbi:MAG: NusA-like transcription termination signal-binding factor [Candidatus Freyarchaeota archaeon]|nr:NusA-like transcription termination signal-binding factor [Candidatus Jordarchaeia archaeon]MBS7269562.1 NusA-like transcription termination signal-binding factor [Candidatus Jordarchaeia archaeon]MBS7280317.1 NusA-like transcription termination signal-binding factor [Candidatus Jordarchaeia archaeon]